MKLSKLYRNWNTHNIVSHPLSQIVYLIMYPFSKDYAYNVSLFIHDFTLPENNS
jgi:hypothetical protein